MSVRTCVGAHCAFPLLSPGGTCGGPWHCIRCAHATAGRGPVRRLLATLCGLDVRFVVAAHDMGLGAGVALAEAAIRAALGRTASGHVVLRQGVVRPLRVVGGRRGRIRAARLLDAGFRPFLGQGVRGQLGAVARTCGRACGVKQRAPQSPRGREQFFRCSNTDCGLMLASPSRDFGARFEQSGLPRVFALRCLRAQLSRMCVRQIICSSTSHTPPLMLESGPPRGLARPRCRR